MTALSGVRLRHAFRTGVLNDADHGDGVKKNHLVEIQLRGFINSKTVFSKSTGGFSL